MIALETILVSHRVVLEAALHLLRGLLEGRLGCSRRLLSHMLWLATLSAVSLRADLWRQAEGLDDNLALHMRTRYIQVFADVQPDRLNLFRSKLNGVLEAKHVARIFQGECVYYIVKTHISYIGVLLGQDEYVTIGILHMLIILDEVLADDWHFLC